MAIKLKNRVKSEKITFRVSKSAKEAFERYAEKKNKLPSEILSNYIDSLIK